MADFAVNTALGGAVSKMMHGNKDYAKNMILLGTGGMVTKDLGLKALSVLDERDDILDKLKGNGADVHVDTGSGLSSTDKMLIGGLGGAALLGGGYLGLRALKQQHDEAAAMREVLANKDLNLAMEDGITMNMPEDKGRVRITLPTKNPGDAETVIELPMGEGMNLSKTLLRNLGRDTKRRLREETKERTRHKKKKVLELPPSVHQ